MKSLPTSITVQDIDHCGIVAGVIDQLGLVEQINQELGCHFRLELYQQIGKAKDALFDLMDAVLTSGSIQSFVSLSQSPVFQRQWSSCMPP